VQGRPVVPPATQVKCRQLKQSGMQAVVLTRFPHRLQREVYPP
jgi:hypothetical protein